MLIQSLLIILLEMDQVEQDPDFIALSRQFKTTAMELISVLEQVLFELDFTIWVFCSERLILLPPQGQERHELLEARHIFH